MIYTRDNPHDSATWAGTVYDATWFYENALPHFNRIEKLHDPVVPKSSTLTFYGTHGYLGLAKKLYRVTIDVNGNDTLGSVQPMVNIYEGRRQSSAYSFLTLIKSLRIKRNLSHKNIV